MTLGRLMELYYAEQQGKQIMMRTWHSGYYSYHEYISEVKITECELKDLVLNEQEDESYTFFIKDEEDKYEDKKNKVMKELSIEQKAKAYDEALEVLKEKFANKEVCGLDKSVLQKLFPQLKESEDERIRKAIIEFFELQDDNTTYSFVPKKDIIAWLEKQGEKHIDRELSNLLNRVIRRFINDPNIPYSERDEVSKKIIPYVKQLEKQGEQKPADKVEPKFKVGDEIIRSSISSCPVHSSTDDTICKVAEIHDVCYILDTKEGKVQEPFEWQDYYELVKRKPTDKVEPKFKVEKDKWYVCTSQYCNCIEGRNYKATSDGRIIDNYGTEYDMHSDAYKWFRPWTIQDAKDGDVLAIEPIEGYYSPFVAIYKKQNEEDFDSYCFIGFDGKFYKGENGHSTEEVHPATKEQCDTLEKAMADAGYTFNFEKKELNEIEQKPAECNNSALKDKLLELFQRFRWYCKDETPTNGDIIEYVDSHIQELIGTMQKPVWSEEDEARFKSCIKILQPSDGYDTINTKWLKSLKDRYTWEPSDEQMKILNEVLDFAANHESYYWNNYIFGILNNLIRQLKKLKS